MKALGIGFKKNKGLGILEIVEPRLGANGVKVRVGVCILCGSELGS